MSKRRVVFSWNRDYNDTVDEVVEFDMDTPDETIEEEYEQWVWDKIGDIFTWYDE